MNQDRKFSKIDYNRARARVLKRLAHLHPQDYEEMMAQELNRPLEARARPLSVRLANNESPGGGGLRI